MGLVWEDDYREKTNFGVGTAFGDGYCKFYAQSGDREYLVAEDDENLGQWHTVVRVGGQPTTHESSTSQDDAIAYAEQWEAEALRAERDARYCTGYQYAERERHRHHPDMAASTQKSFAQLWADVYHAQGLTIDQAWETFKS